MGAGAFCPGDLEMKQCVGVRRDKEGTKGGCHKRGDIEIAHYLHHAAGARNLIINFCMTHLRNGCAAKKGAVQPISSATVAPKIFKRPWFLLQSQD